MAWNQFEHVIWKNFIEHQLQNKNHYVLAVSSGVDSVAMLECCLRLRPKAQFLLLHYHHGDLAVTSKNEAQQKYRDKSLFFLQEKIQNYREQGFKIEFTFEKSNVLLKSEAEFRKARRNFFDRHWDRALPFLIAHHQDDWLETMLLKMIRGTGVASLGNFKMWNGKIFRPFLNVNREQIKKYAKNCNLVWMDDPSNQDQRYLRNWLRNDWLPRLEKHKSQGQAHLAQSLERLIELQTASSTFELCFYNNNQSQGLDRKWYDLLTRKEQLQALNSYLKSRVKTTALTGPDVTSLQLKEIQKRLDKNQKKLTFSVAGANWVINASQIMVQFLDHRRKQVARI